MILQPPQHSEEIKVEFPSRHVLLLKFNRPSALNAMTPQMSDDLKRLLDWFEDEPELWVVIVTGEGRLFCAGADLKAWNNDQQSGKSNEQEGVVATVHGFGSISRRQSVKPIIAAVNGGAYGGGLEMVVNCDIVITTVGAKFAFPEVKRGVVAIQGGIPRLAKIAGHQVGIRNALSGRTVDAAEARDRFGFVNTIVPASELIRTALATAEQIVANSPDAVQSTKAALLLSQKHNFTETVLTHAWGPQSKQVYKGANIKEGLKAFSEKRAPVWTNPKL
ncbi:enoyl-CoA hydratase [Gymnopilus junonius]|uniref:Enoyl-CoA hydratase n=1 Tax=Gymnopilus junonius TaxID=109634 RepID=A0A9P5TPN7_GYMJU|nr:enoyl-CoA hydratase [Gymnopilus junonius]